MPTIPAATTRFDLTALQPDELAALLAELSAAGHVPGATPDGHPGTHIVPGQRINVRDLIDTALDGVGSNSARTYLTYLNDLADGVTVPSKGNISEVTFAGVGDRWLDEVKSSDLAKAVKVIRARAVRSAEVRADVRESLGRAAHESIGDGAVHNAVGAFRRLFLVGVENRHLAPGMEPTRKLKSPKQARSERRALTCRELDEVWEVVTGTGDDPCPPVAQGGR